MKETLKKIGFSLMGTFLVIAIIIGVIAVGFGLVWTGSTIIAHVIT